MMRIAVRTHQDSRKKITVLEAIAHIVQNAGEGLKYSEILLSVMERCSMCSDDVNLPQRPNIQTEPLASLRCGHQVHTACLIHDSYWVNGMNAVCNLCNTTIIEEPLFTYYADRVQERNGENFIDRRIRALWQENEEFRKDVKVIKKMSNMRNGAFKRLYSQIKVLKNTFRENIKPSVEFIKDQQRLLKQAHKKISKTEYTKRNNAFRRCADALKNKYNISLWDLRALETIAGTPNFSRKAMGGRYYWQLKASYLTRLRL